MLVLAAVVLASALWFPIALILAAPALLFVLWFFRDPNRRSDAGPEAMVSPADGKIVEITTVDEPDLVHGRALKVAIFMSVVDVHVNRAPCAATVDWVRHEPGKFLNALAARAGIENERTLIGLRRADGSPVLLKQVAGLIARRIVCPLKPGEALQRGERFGMIKFGSRVEIFLPDDGRFDVRARLGQRVKAGATVLGAWK